MIEERLARAWVERKTQQVNSLAIGSLKIIEPPSMWLTDN